MIFQISSGTGPIECERAVALFYAWLEENYLVEYIDSYPEGRDKETYRSLRFYSDSEELLSFCGSIKWVCQSSYRPHHKRKNWFIDFSVCPVSLQESFSETDVVYTTFRSSGKGGQNVNKVNSAVRALNIRTGQSVVCREERSQHANKVKALARLRQKTLNQNYFSQSQIEKDIWQKHNILQRGGETLVFKGLNFQLSTLK